MWAIHVYHSFHPKHAQSTWINPFEKRIQCSVRRHRNPIRSRPPLKGIRNVWCSNTAKWKHTWADFARLPVGKWSPKHFIYRLMLQKLSQICKIKTKQHMYTFSAVVMRMNLISTFHEGQNTSIFRTIHFSADSRLRQKFVVSNSWTIHQHHGCWATTHGWSFVGSGKKSSVRWQTKRPGEGLE